MREGFCCASVWRDSWSPTACGKSAKMTVDGKPYCKQHGTKAEAKRLKDAGEKAPDETIVYQVPRWSFRGKGVIEVRARQVTDKSFIDEHGSRTMFLGGDYFRTIDDAADFIEKKAHDELIKAQRALDTARSSYETAKQTAAAVRKGNRP